MIHNILVPLDGTAFGEHALPLALALALKAKAAIRVAHVHIPAAPLYNGMELDSDLTLESLVWEQEAAYLDKVIRRLKEVAGVAVSSSLVSGPVGEAFHNLVRSTPADLVVMTTHGRGPLVRFWLGSVADIL